MPLNLEASAEDKAYESEARSTTPEPAEPAKEAPKAEPKTEEKPESKSETAGRDEKGRFSSPKTSDAEVEAESAKEPVKAAEKPKEPPRVAAPKRAPIGALQDERGKRQEAERTAQQALERTLALEAELNKLKNPPKAAPDPNLDPDGYNRWKFEQLEAKVSTFEKETDEQKKTSEQRDAVKKRLDDAGEYEVASIEEFAKARPDQIGHYEEAVKHYRKTMERLLPQFGVRDQATIYHTINDMLLRAVEDAREAGENAAERIWNLSSNLGFRPQGKAAEVITETVKEEPRVDTGNEQLASTLKAVTDQLGVIADGQKASKNVSSSGGKSNKGLTLGELVSMSKGTSLLKDSEIDKISRDQARKLFGE